MCGRYYRDFDIQQMAEHFRAEAAEGDFLPSPPAYNIAPTTIQPVIRQSYDTGLRQIAPMRWGLVGQHTAGPDPQRSTFNARAESIRKSPLWRLPFQLRRCLVPLGGFYEWVRPESRPDDCPAWSHDRTCRPIGSTLGGQAGWQRPAEKPSDNVPAVARLLNEPRGEFRSASTEADRT